MTPENINPVTTEQALLQNMAVGEPSVDNINPVTVNQYLLKYIALNGGGDKSLQCRQQPLLKWGKSTNM